MFLSFFIPQFFYSQIYQLPVQMQAYQYGGSWTSKFNFYLFVGP